MSLNESSILYSFLFDNQSALFTAGEYLSQGTAETSRKTFTFAFVMEEPQKKF